MDLKELIEMLTKYEIVEELGIWGNKIYHIQLKGSK